jgi:parvulin-like peptidyl-prolyl isomerase
MFVRRCAAVAALALLTAGVLSACTGTSPNAAVVNGTDITQPTLLRELHALGANKDFVTQYDASVSQAVAQGQSGSPIFASGTANATYTQGFTAIVLNTDIQSALVHQEVVRRHIEPSAAEVAAATAGAEQQFPPNTFVKFNPWFQAEYKLRTAEQTALEKALGPVASNSAAVKAFYNQNPQDFIATECVSHILVPTQAEASKVRTDLVGGATFVNEARTYSKDTASAIKGGDLGCNPPGNYDPAFERVADTIGVNQLSQPVHSSFGWHLILVRSRQMQPLDTTNSGRIQQFLQQETAVNAFVTAALPAAKVSVNPAFGTWDPVLKGVVAPVAPAANASAPTSTSP